ARSSSARMVMRGSAYQASLVRLAVQWSRQAACVMRVFTGPRDGGAIRSRNANWTNSTLDISDCSERNSDFSDISCSMVVAMDNTPETEGFETLGEAAARLL